MIPQPLSGTFTIDSDYLITRSESHLMGYKIWDIIPVLHKDARTKTQLHITKCNAKNAPSQTHTLQVYCPIKDLMYTLNMKYDPLHKDEVECVFRTREP